VRMGGEAASHSRADQVEATDSHKAGPDIFLLRKLASLGSAAADDPWAWLAAIPDRDYDVNLSVKG
jgi:hypothetical protein